MILAIFIVGVVSFVVGLVFFWLNLNTPVQSCLPAVLLPFGAAFIIGGIGMMLG